MAFLTSLSLRVSASLFFIASNLAHASSNVSLCNNLALTALVREAELFRPFNAGLRMFNVCFGASSAITRPPKGITNTIRHSFVYNTQRSEEHTSELQSRFDLVCRLLLEK